MGLYIGKQGGGEYGPWTSLRKDRIKTMRTQTEKDKKKEKKEKKNILNRVQKSKGGETYDIFPPMYGMCIFFPP